MLYDLTGQIVGHYLITRPIEQGGMATVFLARDIHLRREVAIKVFQSQRDQERTDEVSRRFTREAQIVARLDHPNILQVYDYGEQENLIYLVMPYLARGSLKNMLKERGPVPIPVALHLIFQLLDALQYAHDRKLIHRDIKPGNILFKDSQMPMLADFGLVKEMATSATGEFTAIGMLSDSQRSLSNGDIMGTPYYMAPEQIRGQVKPQSDIYSMGLVLYEMLTGQLPFTTEKQGGTFNIFLKQIYEPPRPIAELNPNISPQLAAAVMQALEKDVARRYQRPADFSLALRSAIDTKPLPTLEGPTSLNLSSDKSDPNATVAVSLDQPLPIALFPTMERVGIPLHTNKSSMDSSNGIAATTTHVLQRASGTPLRRHLPLLLYSILAAIVLTVLGFARPLFLLYSSNTSHHATASANSTEKTRLTQSPATLPISGTQIACPQAGKARAAVLGSSPYQAQGHNAVVYALSSQDKTGKDSSTLMRYDVVTGKSSSIITIPGFLISNAQISGDGQWVIFSTYGYEPGTQPILKPSQIQMVRIDGQGLQTLYCASSSEGSFRYVLASPGLDPIGRGWQLFFANDSTMGILSITTGKILQKFSSSHFYQPLQWGNDQYLYLLDQGTSGQGNSSRQFSVVSLNTDDTLSPSNPGFSVDMSIPKSSACSDLDLGPDFRTIFVSQCQGNGFPYCDGGCNPNEGPSTIDIMKQDPETSNWSKASIFTSSTLAIVQVRAITSSSLLLVVENDDQYNNQNGIWKINTDGSGLKRLSTEKSNPARLNGFSPWFNVARDGSMYAFKTGSTQAVGADQLFVGSLNGGQLTTIAGDGVGSINNAQLEIVGWTTV